MPPDHSVWFFRGGGTGLEQHGTAAGGAKNSPVDCFLVRGWWSPGMSTGMTVVRRTVQDSNRAALTTPVGRVSNQPSGLLLSPRFPTPRNVYRDDYRFVVAVQDSNRNKAKAGYHRGDGILPFANFNSVWYTRLSSTNREHINLSTCFLRPSCKADRGLSSTTFHARTANTLPWEGSADTPFAQ